MNLYQALQYLPSLDKLDEEVAAAISELVNSFMDELLELLQRLKTSGNSVDAGWLPSAAELLNSHMPLIWQFLGHAEVSAAEAVIPAVCKLISCMKKERAAQLAGESTDLGGGFSALAHAEPLLRGLYTRMQYPADFQFDSTDEVRRNDTIQ